MPYYILVLFLAERKEHFGKILAFAFVDGQMLASFLIELFMSSQINWIQNIWMICFY